MSLAPVLDLDGEKGSDFILLLHSGIFLCSSKSAECDIPVAYYTGSFSVSSPHCGLLMTTGHSAQTSALFRLQSWFTCVVRSLGISCHSLKPSPMVSGCERVTGHSFTVSEGLIEGSWISTVWLAQILDTYGIQEIVSECEWVTGEDNQSPWTSSSIPRRLQVTGYGPSVLTGLNESF